MSDVLTAVRSGNHRRVVAALQGLSEAERAAVAPSLVGRDDYRGPTRNLAILGTASMKQMRTVAWGLSWVDGDAGAAVLLDRDPPWLATWAQWILTTQTMMVCWPLVRSLVRAGAIERPPAYTRALLTRRWDEGELPRALAGDPAFWDEDVWLMLAHRDEEGSLRAAEHNGWSELILAADLDRDRLLDAVLAGLVDESAYRAAWFVRMWKALKVTREERAAQVDTLRALLGSAAEPVVSFALEELARPDGSVAAADLAPALGASAKKTVRAALKLLGEEPALAALALAHPDPTIQGEVLDRLERWELDDAARAELLRHLDLLAATQRPRAEALLNLKGPGPFIHALPSDEADDIPAEIRAALNFGGPLPEAPVPGEPVLGDPVEPIASVDELVAVLRTFGDRDRALDGLLRFCDQPAPRALADGWFGFEAQAWVERTVAPVTEHSTRKAASTTERRVARGERGRYLPLPTHAGGWIDPRVLVERLREPAPDEDFTTALFRLAPDHRAEALAAARDVPGRHGELLRCALGGEPVDGEDAFAARAVRLPPLETVEAGVRLTPYEWGGCRCRAYVRPSVDVAFPARRDIAAATALESVWGNLDEYSHAYSGAGELLETLLAPTEPIAPLTLRLVVATLGSGYERERLLAVDVLVAAIEDGRVDTLPTEDVPHIKPNRLAARLQPVAAAGPLHAAVVRDFLDASIHQVAERPGPLLVLFDELSAQTGTGPRLAREHLATLKHKSAKALLRRDGEPSPDEARLALAARARRARRWSTR